jgi:hypothetical protein
MKGPANASLSRARTFPAPGPTPASPRGSLDGARLDGEGFQVNTASNPSLRNSFTEFMNSSDLSAAGTPDSINSNYAQPQQFGINNGLPDLSTMMFSSADPFAYPPNQPMMEYENGKEDTMGAYSNSPNPAIYVRNNAPNPGVYDDLEGQIFGPLPPYLTHGQQNLEFQGQMGMGAEPMGNIDPAFNNYPTALSPEGNMNFVLSGDGGGWSNTFNDQQRFRQQ